MACPRLFGKSCGFSNGKHLFAIVRHEPRHCSYTKRCASLKKKKPWNKMKSSFEIIYTKDNKLLDNYIKLRNELYFRGLGFNVKLDIHDIKGEHLLILKNSNVIGGARLIRRFPGDLPLEENGFRLVDYIDLSKYDDKQIGEVGRISIIEDERNIELLQKVFESLCEKALQIGIEIILTIAPRHIARMTAFMCHKSKYKVEIIRNLPMADYSLYSILGEMNLVIITK
jgi:hypothetical protein